MFDTSPQSQFKAHQRMLGFTIIELMITLAVAAILASLAAPSFTNIIKNTRLVTQVNNLASGLNFARSEAIKRSMSVTLCHSNNGAICNGSWTDGWIIFEEDPLSVIGTFDGSDTLLRVGDGAGTDMITLVFSVDDHLTYNANGFATGFASTFKFCDDRGVTFGKGLVVSNNGRVRTAQTADITSCS